MNSNDVMLDLETLGVNPGCAILSIGACTFDGQILFYEKISKESCFRKGLREDPATAAWWAKQSPEARNEAFSGVRELSVVLGLFSDWMRTIPPYDGRRIFVWGNGADFDLPILEAAYQVCDMKKPWQPYNGRCYRTLKNLYPEILADETKRLKHKALDDALYQASHAKKILQVHFAKA